MSTCARLIWGFLIRPTACAKGIVERPPFGLSIGLLAGISLTEAFLTPVDDRGGYPLGLWIAWVVGLALVASFGLTFVTWIGARRFGAPTRFDALYCVSQLSALTLLPAIPLYPVMKENWAGYHAWNGLYCLLLAWSSWAFVRGVCACCGSPPRKAAGLCAPALAVSWGLGLWAWLGAPPLEGAYPWTSHDSARVRVYYPGSSPKTEIERIAGGSEAVLAKVCRVLEVEPPVFRTRLFLFPTDHLHRKFVPNEWSDPAAFAHREAISLVYAPWSEMRDTMAHEFGHIVSIDRIAPELSMQPLLCEGLAEYVRDALSQPSGAEPDEDPLYPTTGTPLRTLSRIEVFFDEQAMSIGGNSYPHAGSFVRYLIRKHGLDRFKQLCRESTDGGLWANPVEELETAMQSIYGQSLAEAELEWRGTERPPLEETEE